MTIGEKIKFLLEHDEEVKERVRILKGMKFISKGDDRTYFELSPRVVHVNQGEGEHYAGLELYLRKRLIHDKSSSYIISSITLRPLESYRFPNENH